MTVRKSEVMSDSRVLY